MKVSVRWGCNPKARQMRLTRVVAQPAALGHGPGAPVGRVLGGGLQRQRNHTLHVVIGNRSRPSAARFVRQSVQPPFQEPGTPLPHRLIGHSQVGAHRGIAAASAQPKIILARSAKACAVFRTANPPYQGFTLHLIQITGGIGRPIAMVILLWIANPEDTSS